MTTLNTINPGVDTNFSTKLNENFNNLLALQAAAAGMGINNLTRQLIDRDVAFSADGSEWAEAYTSAGGRKDSVVTAETTAFYSSPQTGYLANVTPTASGDTTDDPDSFDNVANAFDFDTGTLASKSSSGNFTWNLGKTFSSRFIQSIRIFASTRFGRISSGSTGTTQARLRLFIDSGSGWELEATLADSTNTGLAAFTLSSTFNSVYLLNKEVQGIRLEFRGTAPTSSGGTRDARVWVLDYGNVDDASIVVHDVDNLLAVDKVVGNAIVSNNDILPEFKLINTDDSYETDWLSSKTVHSIELRDYDKCHVKIKGGYVLNGSGVMRL